jgi:hypothetical protein
MTAESTKQKNLKLGLCALTLVLTYATGAQAQSTTLDTTSVNNPQVFGVGGHPVGTWTTSLLTLNTQLWTASTITTTGTLNAGTVAASNTITTPSLNVNSGTLVVSTTGTVTATGQGIWSPAYYHNSDARLKTGVHPISGALDKILALKGVEFNWKSDGRADMGVVAQNVAAVFPNVVIKDDKGMMSVEYDSLVGPMIEAIRELKSENDALRQKVDAIGVSVQDLKAENAKLRSISGSGHDAIPHASSLNP